MRIFGVLFLSFSVGVLSSLAASPALSQEINQEDASGFQFDQDIDFDMDDFEGFEDGSFGAAETTSEEDAAVVMIGTTVFVLAIAASLLGLVLTAVAAYMLYDALNAIPSTHQEIAPFIPWLLFLPVINIVVLFLVFIKVPDSLRGYLESTGNTTQGDCGKSLGLWGAVASLIGCFFPVGIVLLYMSLSKINQAKQIIRTAPAA